MTSPNADQEIQNHLGGVTPTGAPLDYQFSHAALGRVTYSSEDGAGPYQTAFVPGNPVAGSAATYDQVTSLLRMGSGRHIDPLGNMIDAKKAWLIDYYWKLDGCPMPLTREKLAMYRQKADVLRPWPTTAVAAFKTHNYTLPASENQVQDYSSIDPNTPLDKLT